MIAKIDTKEYARELDRRAVECLRRRSAIDLELGEVLLALFTGDRLLRLHCSKQSDYAREVLGMPVRTMRQFTRLAEGLRERPILRRAVAEGMVSMRKALIVMAVAVGEDEDAWTAAAARMTEKELRGRLRQAGGRPPEEPFDVESVILLMDPDQQDRLDAALPMAWVPLGGVKPKWMAVEAIAMEWASGHGLWWPEEEGGRIEVGSRPSLVCDSPADAADPPWLPDDPVELDRMARGLAAARLTFDLEFGPILRKLMRRRVWWELGFDSPEEYARDRLGVSTRTIRQRIWLERRMDDLPELREALKSGTLTFTKALFVAKDAEPENVVERIALAASTTLQQTERESDAEESRQNRAAGVRRLWGPKDAFGTVSMAILACQRMYRERGEFLSAGEALARMADHFADVWREEVEMEKRRQSKKRREVMGRNGGYCAVPGCTRPAEHDHHVHFRSRGGSDDVSNRIPLCAAHHLRSIHRGWAEVSGRAGARLTWKFGSGERFVTLGDDDVVRVE